MNLPTPVIIGIDLSGPSNTQDTALVVFFPRDEELRLEQTAAGIGDGAILEIVSGLSAAGNIAVGLDAPLSYNPGGGDRPGDQALRTALHQAGLASGSVMTPTMTRMAYLTLRGMAVARGLELAVGKKASAEKTRIELAIAEVHPAGALILRGAPLQAVRDLKSDPAGRQVLLAWLEAQGLRGTASLTDADDHLVAACAAALGVWGWMQGRPAWNHPAQPPLHPYAYVC